MIVVNKIDLEKNNLNRSKMLWYLEERFNEYNYLFQNVVKNVLESKGFEKYFKPALVNLPKNKKNVNKNNTSNVNLKKAVTKPKKKSCC